MKAPSARILQRAFLYKRKPRDYRAVFFYTKNPETLRFRDFGGDEEDRTLYLLNAIASRLLKYAKASPPH